MYADWRWRFYEILGLCCKDRVTRIKSLLIINRQRRRVVPRVSYRIILIGPCNLGKIQRPRPTARVQSVELNYLSLVRVTAVIVFSVLST